jgi:GTP-binding protein
MKFLEYAPVVFLSAKTGAGIDRVWPLVREGYDSASVRITTGELNRFLRSLAWEREAKLLYMTQAAVRPPTFVLFTDRPAELHFSDERYLANQIRKRFGFKGTPLVVKTRSRHRK